MSNEKITPSQVLLPVFLLALSMLVFLGFQTSLLVNDRTAISNNYAQQEKPLEQSAKIKAQLTALVSGTVKLAQSGNKNAQVITDQLKKSGLLQDKPQEQAAPNDGALPSSPSEAKLPEAK